MIMIDGELRALHGKRHSTLKVFVKVPTLGSILFMVLRITEMRLDGRLPEDTQMRCASRSCIAVRGICRATYRRATESRVALRHANATLSIDGPS